ncbi:PspA/IM30 family protein [Propionivibrio sp.]|uniref:PspA/IM30 family protein n=1 Tax=Propionivibrio sp. TaxID=2212460 RepID=UPI0039E4AC10
MADSIATRVSRIIAGGAHALLDRAENMAPEVSMAQSLREIEQVVGEVRGDLGKVEAAKHLVLTQIARLNSEHESMAEKIEAALSGGRDDLAKAAIGRQADIEDLLPVLQKSLDEQHEKAKELESYIVALSAKKRELEQLLADFRESQLTQRPADAIGGERDRQSRVENAAASFNRVLVRQTGANGLVGTVGGDAAKLKELAELQREHRISERLAAIKAARGN